MSKFLYPIYKLKTKSYIKWWLYHKKAGGSGILSEILEGFSFNLENTLNRKFKLFEIEGNSEQETTTGKNRVDVTSGTTNIPSTLTLTQNADGTLALNGNTGGTLYYAIQNMKFANIVNGNSYKLVTKVKSGTWNAGVIGMQFIDSNAQQIQSLQNSRSSQESKVINGDVNEVRLYLSGTFSATNLVIEIMLVNANETDDTFEKFTYGASPNPNYKQPIYRAGDNGSINEKITNSDGTKEQDYSIPVQQPMRSNKDKTIKDKFVVKSDNKKYERHYIGEVVLNGSEEIYLYNDNGNRAVFYINVSDLYDYTNSAETPELLSNRFRPVSQTATWEPGGIACRIGERAIFFIFETGTTVNDFKNWLSAHNVVVQYKLAEPLDLPCTEEQIQQLENLPSTYKDFTIINSEDETPAHLKIQYYKEG